MTKKSANINVMQQAARKVSGRLLRDFGEVENLQTSRKGPANFVTVADQRTDRMLMEILSKARPDFGFLTEEHGTQAGRDETRRWIIDPIDGTTNFLHGIPYFAISIALEEQGKISAGIVYQPVADEMFWAERGIGAYLNDRRIRVSSREALDEALVATGIPHLGQPRLELALRTVAEIAPKVAGIRRFGAAALDLAYVAAGRYDAYWERDLNIWDLAAGVILVREAGGLVATPEGRGDYLVSGDIVASNAALHQDLARLIKDVGAKALA